MRSPLLLRTGPPESPGQMAALGWRPEDAVLHTGAAG